MSHSAHPELYQRAETQTRNADAEAVDRVSWCDAGGREREDRGVRRQTRHRVVHHRVEQCDVCTARALETPRRGHASGHSARSGTTTATADRAQSLTPVRGATSSRRRLGLRCRDRDVPACHRHAEPPHSSQLTPLLPVTGYWLLATGYCLGL